MMQSWRLSQLTQPLVAQLIGSDTAITGVSTDSRSIADGDLFVALRGDNFDGHDYLQQVRQAGARAAIVDCEVTEDMPVLKVMNTEKALGLLGAHNRNAFVGPLVGITGSGGKTTTKNMIAAILSQRGRTLATQGNYNNQLGVPLTLLKLSPEHEFAVVEMGAAGAGDIAYLVELGRPSIAVLLNALPAHLQGFGSIDGVATAKAEIFDDLGADDVAIFNADLRWAQQWRTRAGKAKVLDFGFSATAAVRAHSMQSLGLQGTRFSVSALGDEFSVFIPLPGKHNVANALAAIAVGLSCEISQEEICRGLKSLSSVAGRLENVEAASGAQIIDDCYNANPESVKAAIDVLAQCDGRRTLVLGAMRELGADSDALHIEVVEYAAANGVDQLWGVGPELKKAVTAFAGGGHFFASREDAINATRNAFSEGDYVLVKGSRGAKMELVLAALVNTHKVRED
ncbi:MAG: UDP-N-acetylmuramoyl-tripeptide--D-alanyl-D-alanine ligase [Halioglobus sp.]|jgi:UDP-N-acetylmuramoyl-tripeptide--D-alanyl-D-alanine ligase